MKVARSLKMKKLPRKEKMKSSSKSLLGDKEMNASYFQRKLAWMLKSGCDKNIILDST